jgi:hypothetical protein
MLAEKPRAKPPCLITTVQSRHGSRELKLQSLKSGGGGSSVTSSTSLAIDAMTTGARRTLHTKPAVKIFAGTVFLRPAKLGWQGHCEQHD